MLQFCLVLEKLDFLNYSCIQFAATTNSYKHQDTMIKNRPIPSPRSSATNGFNLIEAAIVLGIVGLVIGGIWVAAAAVNDHYKWQKTEAGWLYYMDIIAKNFNPKSYPNQAQTDLHPFLANFPPPAGWSIDASLHPVDPYGYQFYAQAYAGAAETAVGYNWQTPTMDFCIKAERMILTKIAKAHVLGFNNLDADCATDVSQCCTDGGANTVWTYFYTPPQ